MSTNVAAMIKAGVTAFQSGDRVKARQMLEKAIELDQYSEMAWLWLSAVVESKEEQRTCLENVLVINPENERARLGLKSLGIDPDTVLSGAEETTDSDDYAVPSSSVSVNADIEEASTEEYDDWVGNLGIGGDEANNVRDSADLFGDDDFSSDASFDFGEDLFGDEDYDPYDEAGYSEYSDYDATVVEADDLFDESGDLDDLYADKTTLDEFGDALDENIDDYDMDEFSGDPFADEADEDEPTGPTLESLFAQIPATIKPTRLPGTIEKAPAAAYIPIVLLVFLNIGAIIFVAFQFML